MNKVSFGSGALTHQLQQCCTAGDCNLYPVLRALCFALYFFFSPFFTHWVLVPNIFGSVNEKLMTRKNVIKPEH